MYVCSAVSRELRHPRHSARHTSSVQRCFWCLETMRGSIEHTVKFDWIFPVKQCTASGNCLAFSRANRVMQSGDVEKLRCRVTVAERVIGPCRVAELSTFPPSFRHSSLSLTLSAFWPRTGTYRSVGLLFSSARCSFDPPRADHAQNQDSHSIGRRVRFHSTHNVQRVAIAHAHAERGAGHLKAACIDHILGLGSHF